ncbi:hypothetical protein ZWY2020_056805 [Hordeum vulgare]|nr:hypothetical protein ZWY2020_056805 [Hordeum vulgare]
MWRKSRLAERVGHAEQPDAGRLEVGGKTSFSGHEKPPPLASLRELLGVMANAVAPATRAWRSGAGAWVRTRRRAKGSSVWVGEEVDGDVRGKRPKQLQLQPQPSKQTQQQAAAYGRGARDLADLGAPWRVNKLGAALLPVKQGTAGAPPAPQQCHSRGPSRRSWTKIPKKIFQWLNLAPEGVVSLCMGVGDVMQVGYHTNCDGLMVLDKDWDVFATQYHIQVDDVVVFNFKESNVQGINITCIVIGLRLAQA